MSDEPCDARAAAPTLREYLADRDVPCDQCGYNLRGAQDVFCPECGAVIPRPPAEHIARKKLAPAALKLWCPECDYVVTGVNAERCPECSATGLERFSGDKPKMRRRFWWRPRGLPVPLLLNALFGVVLLVPAIGRWVVEAGSSRSSGGLALAMAGAVFAMLPGVIAAVWTVHRRRIRCWTPTNRRYAAGVAFLAGLLCWMAAVAAVK